MNNSGINTIVRQSSRSVISAVFVMFISEISLQAAYAYIGPGAGFALVGSSAVLIAAIFFGIIGILFLPFRLLVRAWRYRSTFKNAKLKRLIILGFDGMDPRITEQMLEAGELPALKELKEKGQYSRLRSTIPSMSPVAWSTFQTGVNPGAHNVFDFLTRDKRTYFPGMVSVETKPIWKRSFFRKKQVDQVILTRKSKPFWKVLGDSGVFNTILRVPISYPPERLKGNILSAMCTPDVRGSQGTFMFFTSDSARVKAATSGEFALLENKDDFFKGLIKGPSLGGKSSEIEIKLKIIDEKNVSCDLLGQTYKLELDQFSDWIKLEFDVGGNRVPAISRFLIKSINPHLSLYISPANVDPEDAVLPISYPKVFSKWLSKTIGSFGTLGFLEDTWGRNEQALDDRAFLEQLVLNQKEREKMLFEVLAKVNRGLCTCVFDGTDRVQHMFWRYREKNHPAPKESNAEYHSAIENVYKAMDRVTRKVLDAKKVGDEVIVLSDHGFGSFRRCVNLNYWLMQQGYLVLKDGCKGDKDYLVDVDWSKTKAFALGITGIYLNREGRERFGIVKDGEHEDLAKEISQKLTGLVDPQDNQVAIKKVFLAKDIYKGLYVEEAPDLIMGYHDGYRVSWESVTGAVETSVFSDNTKAWSGDHHIYPEDVPGVLFTSFKFDKADPGLIDLAPTVLKLFGVKAPGYMEGKSLF